LTVATDEASIEMVGAGQLVAARPTGAVTTTILSLAGPVLVTPQNSALAPVTLNTGDWVRVSPDAVSPVHSIFTTHVYLPMVRQ
jgi:hypothetical protein